MGECFRVRRNGDIKVTTKFSAATTCEAFRNVRHDRHGSAANLTL